MPPLPLVPNVIKITTNGNLYDSEWLNVWHMNWSGSAPSAGDLGTFLSTYWKPGWDALFHADASEFGTTLGHFAVDLTTDTGAEASVTDSEIGTRTGDVTPGSAAVMCSLEIGRRYRGGHPRKYLPLGTAGTYASGSSKFWDSGFTAAVTSDFQGFFDTIIAKLVGSTTFQNLVNVSYVSGGVRRSDAVVDQVTGFVIRDRICSQRRRLGKIDG